MISFTLNTYRAQINAWPCPPDHFQIIVEQLDQLSARCGIQIPMFNGFTVTEVPDKLRGIIRLVYQRDRDPRKPNRVHDLILYQIKGKHIAEIREQMLKARS